MIRVLARLARPALTAAFLMSLAAPAAAQIDARMLRYPDVSATQIAFTYAGDVWVAPKTGGVAARLSSPRGEEVFARFSPDGRTLAYSANYDGNTDVYTVPVQGGDPVRLTWHPTTDRVLDWHPDGTRVLFASSRESGRQRYNQFYLVSAKGGPAEKLPVPYGEFAAYAPDGKRVAYLPQSQAFRTWKRYRGGWAPDVWVFDLTTQQATNVTSSDANDEHPMWHGDTLYFLSDRGTNQRANIWARNAATGALRQVTQFTDFDVTFPAIGPNDIVFEAGGRLYLLDLATEKTSEVHVQVITDRQTLKPRSEPVAELIRFAGPSPTGKRAVFEARGDVFTVPAEHGPVMNLTRTSGSAERYPRWSPDGKTLAWWSDKSGEYELMLQPADGAGEAKAVTTLGAGYRYPVQWSPDSKRLAFMDETERLRVLDVASGKLTEIDRVPTWLAHDQLENFVLRWSPDSRWLVWARGVKETANTALFLYDTSATGGAARQITSGYFADAAPVFDPEGKYLFFLSNRAFEPVYSDFDNSWTYPNSTRIVAMTLRKDVPSPLAARNDVEGDDKDKEKEKEKEKEKDKDKDKDADKPKDDKADAAKKDDAAKSAKDEKKDDAKKDDVKPVAIDLDGLEARVVALPPKPGNYSQLAAVKGKLLYRRGPRTGSGEEKGALVYYDLEEREEKTVLSGLDAFQPTADGKKLFVLQEKKFGFVDVKADVKIDKPLRTAELEATIDPKAEWNQMFADAFRFQRDFFYDPGLHGVDWPALRTRYQALIDASVTRWDVNYVLGEFMGELNASHTYRGGGDLEEGAKRNVGLLGVDWELANGAYRIKHIAEGAAWDADARSPLREPGVNVKAGDYVLAVNGVALRADQDPLAAFQGLADKTVVLTVNGTPAAAGARQVTVKCLADDTGVRFREWIEERRARVDKATNGRVGYIYVQSTGVEAQNELMRQFMAQWRKDALIIDERFNSGGQIPDRFIELLNRPMLAYWAVRQGEDWQWPPIAHRGPKVMLINGWSGSGGDAFPFYFREAKLGPLVGTRTWGGLIGLSGAPELVDGGGFTVPTFRMYDVRGEWFAEGRGVEPDIRVDEDPTQLAKGVDPQLERAITEAMARLKDAPPAPARPKYERRTAPAPSPTATTAERP